MTMSLEEAAERLITAVRDAFADRDDADPLPLRQFMVELAEVCGVPDGSWDEERVPEWSTVGELREMTRAALADLAHGETIP